MYLGTLIWLDITRKQHICLNKTMIRLNSGTRLYILWFFSICRQIEEYGHFSITCRWEFECARDVNLPYNMRSRAPSLSSRAMLDLFLSHPMYDFLVFKVSGAFLSYFFESNNIFKPYLFGVDSFPYLCTNSALEHKPF